MPALVFLSFAPEDDAQRAALQKHLTPLIQEFELSVWHAGLREAGADSEATSRQQLDAAALVLLLLSADYFASEECLREMARAVGHAESGKAHVVAIVVRPCLIDGEALARVRMLPTSGEPVTTWPNKDEAWLDVVSGIRAALAEMTKHPAGHSPTARDPARAWVRGVIGRSAARAAKEGRPREETILLERVHSFWIEGVLHRSLNEEVRLDLARDERSDAVDRGFELQVERFDERDEPLAPGESIADYFERRQRALLILGEPGSGKTITLLELTAALLARAAADPALPVPIVLSLSSWNESRRPIADWIVDQLSQSYSVPHRIGKQWLAAQRLAFCLDGLDEVAADARDECALAINRFREEQGLSPIAIACRRAQYEELRSRLKLDTAIQLRELSDSQIEAYLAAGGERLAPLAEVLAADAHLRELARTPLMLNVMTLALASDPEHDGGAGALLPSGGGQVLRRYLFDRYVERMFRRSEGRTRYSRERTLQYLSWLAKDMAARGQTLFLLENLQPASLMGWGAKLLYLLVTRVAAVSALALLFVQSVQAAVFGLGAGVSLALADAVLVFRSSAKHRSGQGWLEHFIAVVWFSFMSSLLVVAFFGVKERVLWSAVLAAVLGCIFGPRRRNLAAGRDTTTVERIGVRWKRMVVLTLLVAVLPVVGGALIRWSSDSDHLTLWKTSSFEPERLRVEGRACFTANDRLAIKRNTRNVLAIVDPESGEIQTSGPVAESHLVCDTETQVVLSYQSEGAWRARVWDSSSWQNRSALEQPRSWQPGPVKRPRLALRGTRALSANWQVTWLHDAQNGSFIAELPGPEAEVTSDRRHARLHHSTRAPQLFRLDTGAEVALPTGSYEGSIIDIDVHPTEGWLAVLNDRGCLSRIDPRGQTPPRALGECDSISRSRSRLFFSPDGARLIVLSPETTALRDTEGRLIARPRGNEFTAGDEPPVDFSRDGSLFMVRGETSVRLYRSKTGEPVGEARSKYNPVYDGSALRPDGTYLLTYRVTGDQTDLGFAVFVLAGLIGVMALSIQTGVMEMKTRVNQGIRLTAERALGATIVCTGLFTAVPNFMAFAFVRDWTIELPLRLTAAIGVSFGLIFGGFDLFQHYLLRLILAVRGHLPLRAVRFLDGAAQQIFLRKVGGGYLFIHRLVLEHFARDAHRLLGRDR